MYDECVSALEFYASKFGRFSISNYSLGVPVPVVTDRRTDINCQRRAFKLSFSGKIFV